MHALVLDSANYLRMVPEVRKAIPGARLMVTLPLVFVGDDDLPTVMSTFPEVNCVPVDRELLNVLQGLDRAGLICSHLDDELTVGGVIEAAKYPVLIGEPVGTFAGATLCAAVNLSQTPPDDDVAPSDLQGAVNQATRALAELTVPVVAAGNRHSADAEFETVSPWAEPDWVVSVGATSDAAGLVEAPTSGRGSARNPQVGPDVLAWGQSGLTDDPRFFGTSFAAPRVSFLVAFVRAWLLQLVANVDRALGFPFGVPLVGVAVIDRAASVLPHRQTDAAELDALPVFGTRQQAFDVLPGETLRSIGQALSWPATAQISRQLLLEATAATGPRPTLSAPFADLTAVVAYLDNYPLGKLLALLKLPAEAGDAVGEALFPAGTAERLLTVVSVSMPIWNIDIDGGRPFVSFYHWSTVEGV